MKARYKHGNQGQGSFLDSLLSRREQEVNSLSSRLHQQVQLGSDGDSGSSEGSVSSPEPLPSASGGSSRSPSPDHGNKDQQEPPSSSLAFPEGGLPSLASFFPNNLPYPSSFPSLPFNPLQPSSSLYSSNFLNPLVPPFADGSLPSFADRALHPSVSEFSDSPLNLSLPIPTQPASTASPSSSIRPSTSFSNDPIQPSTSSAPSPPQTSISCSSSLQNFRSAFSNRSLSHSNHSLAHAKSASSNHSQQSYSSSSSLDNSLRFPSSDTSEPLPPERFHSPQDRNDEPTEEIPVKKQKRDRSRKYRALPKHRSKLWHVIEEPDVDYDDEVEDAWHRDMTEYNEQKKLAEKGDQAAKLVMDNLSKQGLPQPELPLLPLTLTKPSSLFVRALASSASRRPRGEKKPIPETQKDDRYFERRKRNNMAAKKSRDNRKQREDQIALRATLLEKENAILRAQVATLREEANSLRHLILQKKPRFFHDLSVIENFQSPCI